MALAAISIAISCSKDDPATNNPDPNPNPNPTPVSTAEIGYDGGTMTYTGFEMVVPDACFNGYFELSLLEHPTQTVYGTYEASKFYTLEGFPLEFLEPIEIQLESTSGSDLFAVAGLVSRAASTDSAMISFQFIDVTQQGSTCTFVLEPNDIPDYATDDTVSVVLGLVKDYTKISAKSQFVVYCPKIYVDDAYYLQDFLDEAYSHFQNSPLNFSYLKRTKWPVEVTVRKLGSGTYGYFVPSKWGNNSGYMEFNQDYLSDKEELKTTAGHEFFHLVQALYDPRYAFTKAISPSSYYWVEEAASVWSEAWFSTDANYVSIVRNGHQMAPFNGMLEGAAENPQHHGYGMSALIKYLADNYGQEYLVKIFEHEQSGSTDILGGFNNALPKPMSEIYADFLHAYISSEVYGDFGAGDMLGNLSGTFAVNGANDTIKEFEMEYKPLSAKVFKIDINYAGFTDQNSMLIKSESSIKKLIYKLKGAELTYLGSAFGDFNVLNLQQIQQENALILVVPVLHYYSSSEEKVLFQIQSTPPMQFEGCRFSLKYLPAVEHVTLPSGSTMTQDITYNYTYDDDYFRTGTYTNGNYWCSWDEVDGSWRHYGSMHLIIDEQNKMIVSGTIEAAIQSVSNPDETYKNMEISFKNIPSTSWGESEVWFGIMGSNFCNPEIITSFDENSAQTGFIRYLLSYSCSSINTFGIKLSVAANKE